MTGSLPHHPKDEKVSGKGKKTSARLEGRDEMAKGEKPYPIPPPRRPARTVNRTD